MHNNRILFEPSFKRIFSFHLSSFVLALNRKIAPDNEISSYKICFHVPENFSYLANFAKLWNNFWSRAKPEMIIRIPTRTQLQPRIWKWFRESIAATIKLVQSIIPTLSVSFRVSIFFIYISVFMYRIINNFN